MMIVEIDGNDGVGKTTCINILKQHFGDDIEFKDRGALTLATDSDEFNKEKGVCYILLDCSVKECQNRIQTSKLHSNSYYKMMQIGKRHYDTGNGEVINFRKH